MTKPKDSRFNQVETSVREFENQMSGFKIRMFVHFSDRLWDRDPLKRASIIFRKQNSPPPPSAIMLYINSRARRFAIVTTDSVAKLLPKQFWGELATHLETDLKCTHPHNAVAITIRTIAVSLLQFGAQTQQPDQL